MTQPKLPTGWWLWRTRASEMRWLKRLRRWTRIGSGGRVRRRWMPARGRASAGRSHVPIGGRPVELLDVLLEHAARRELPDRAGHRVAHHLQPALRQALLVALVVHRHDLVLEQSIQVLRVRPVLRAFVRVRLAAADGPAVGAVVALVPPAVEHGAVDDPVHGGLHAARARCLERPARVVQPHVDALDEVARRRGCRSPRGRRRAGRTSASGCA